MAKKTVDAGALALAVALGAGLGIVIGLGGAAVGLPQKVAGPLAGAVTGGLVPIIYAIRTRRHGGGEPPVPPG